MSDLLQQALSSHQAGRIEEAESLYRRILEAEPRNANALYLLGVLEHEQGKYESAAASLEEALRAGGPHAVALHDLGKTYFQMKRFAEAKRCFGKALALEPGYAEAHGNLGVTLAALGETAQALPSLRRALTLQPGYAIGHYNLGNVLYDLGSMVEAEAGFREALRLDPGLADAHHSLGDLLTRTGRYEDARKQYEEALRLGKSSALVYVALGNVLNPLGEFEQAEQAYARAFEQDPNSAGARWGLAIMRLRSLDAGEQDATSAAAAELEDLSAWLAAHPVEDATRVVNLEPFYLAYHEKNHRDLFGRYGRLCADLMGQWWQGQERRQTRRAPRTSGPIRVGIVSSHVYDHSAWIALIKGWALHLDRARFEHSVFHLGWTQDAETALAKSSAAHFKQGAANLREWTEAILERRPDVLLYSTIGEDPTTTQLAALRLAPLQLAAWGHPETSGLPTIDYYLSAQAFEPENAQAHYTERLVSLPNLGCCYSRLAPPCSVPDLAALGIDPEATLLLCPGMPFKYIPEHDWIFPEIARRAGNCRLIFFDLLPKTFCEQLKQRLAQAFAHAQVEYDRHVVFVPRLSRAAYYGMMQRADLLLDTIGFSGFNTAMQAVECGLPIVAYEGRFMRGRFASGILRRMGMDEWVATSEERFVALVAELANHPEKRRDARSRIEAARDALFDDLAPIRALEDFLVGAVPR